MITPKHVIEHPSARCSLWWGIRGTDHDGLGYIGRFEAHHAGSAQALLAQAKAILSENQCAWAVGPIDGSTWDSYRFVTWSDGSPVFPGEPEHPVEWPQWWVSAGFEPWHTYHSSARSLAQHQSSPRVLKALDRLQGMGVTFRGVSADTFEDDLPALYPLCLEAFSQNPLATSIGVKEFLQRYAPLTPLLDSRWCLIAEYAGKPCGFALSFALSATGPLLIKTLATNRQPSLAGLGLALVDKVETQAAQVGITTVIHALMHDHNFSAKIGANEPIRRYTLFRSALP